MCDRTYGRRHNYDLLEHSPVSPCQCYFIILVRLKMVALIIIMFRKRPTLKRYDWRSRQSFIILNLLLLLKMYFYSIFRRKRPARQSALYLFAHITSRLRLRDNRSYDLLYCSSQRHVLRVDLACGFLWSGHCGEWRWSKYFLKQTFNLLPKSSHIAKSGFSNKPNNKIVFTKNVLMYETINLLGNSTFSVTRFAKWRGGHNKMVPTFFERADNSAIFLLNIL